MLDGQGLDWPRPGSFLKGQASVGPVKTGAKDAPSDKRRVLQASGRLGKRLEALRWKA
jgi:hypothetical protein